MKLNLCKKIFLTILFIFFGVLGIWYTIKTANPAALILDAIMSFIIGVACGVGIHSIWFLK